MGQAEFLDAFGYRATVLDLDTAWMTDQPESEWTPDDQRREELEKAEEELYWIAVRAAMALYWEHEGVRCATLNRNPEENPYR